MTLKLLLYSIEIIPREIETGITLHHPIFPDKLLCGLRYVSGYTKFHQSMLTIVGVMVN